MRWIVLFVSLVGALAASTSGQAQMFRAASKHVPMPTFDLVDYKLNCPMGYVPTSYSATPQYPYDLNEDQFRLFIDPNGTTIDKNSLTSGAQLNGGGYSLSVYNTEHHDKNLQALVTCVALNASADGAFTIARTNGTIARSSQGSIISFCPADSPVAFGGYSNADAVSSLDYGGGPVWGTAAAPILLSSLSDGATMGPPTGWLVRIYNAFSNAQLAAMALCGKATGMQSFIYSVATPGSSFGLPTAFSMFAPVPEGYAAVNLGYDGGTQGQYLSTDVWMDDGTLAGLMQWYANSTSYDSGPAQVRAFMVHGQGNATGGRAVVAVLALPTAAPPPPTPLTIVEFYNATLDHYFITGIADEITKLDNGTFKGWARTGETFNAYAPGSSGRTGRRPVCREYGNPLYGLDSHFYSASPDECAASMVNTFGSWLLESTEVFQMDLPTTAGACPPGGVPVYRIWNNRKDSNHRYTTKTSIRDQMVAKGGVAEGYGNSAVALCGLQ